MKAEVLRAPTFGSSPPPMCDDASNHIVATYADGGVIGSNPSKIGGTWAHCCAGKDGRRLLSAHGVVQPAEVDLPVITNNLTELLAVLLALESLPNDWSGALYTDSYITLLRVRGFQPGQRPSKFNGIPDDLCARLETAVARLGPFACTLLGGHPTKADLARGCRADGTPVSAHNVYCDQLCAAQARNFLRARCV